MIAPTDSPAGCPGKLVMQLRRPGPPSQFRACPLTTDALHAGCDMTTGQLHRPYRPHAAILSGRDRMMAALEFLGDRRERSSRCDFRSDIETGACQCNPSRLPSKIHTGPSMVVVFRSGGGQTKKLNLLRAGAGQKTEPASHRQRNRRCPPRQRARSKDAMLTVGSRTSLPPGLLNCISQIAPSL